MQRNDAISYNRNDDQLSAITPTMQSSNLWFKLAMLLLCITLITCVVIDLNTRAREIAHRSDLRQAHLLLCEMRRKRDLTEETTAMLAEQEVRKALAETREKQQKLKKERQAIHRNIIERLDDIYKFEVEMREISDKVTELEKMERNDMVRARFTRVMRELEQIVADLEEVLAKQDKTKDEILTIKLLEANKSRPKRSVERSDEVEQYINSLKYKYDIGFTLRYCPKSEDLDYKNGE